MYNLGRRHSYIALSLYIIAICRGLDADDEITAMIDEIKSLACNVERNKRLRGEKDLAFLGCSLPLFLPPYEVFSGPWERRTVQYILSSRCGVEFAGRSNREPVTWLVAKIGRRGYVSRLDFSPSFSTFSCINLYPSHGITSQGGDGIIMEFLPIIKPPIEWRKILPPRMHGFEYRKSRIVTYT